MKLSHADSWLSARISIGIWYRLVELYLEFFQMIAPWFHKRIHGWSTYPPPKPRSPPPPPEIAGLIKVLLTHGFPLSLISGGAEVDDHPSNLVPPWMKGVLVERFLRIYPEHPRNSYYGTSTFSLKKKALQKYMNNKNRVIWNNTELFGLSPSQ